LERVGALKKEFEFKDVVLGKPDVGKKFDAATVDMINVFAQGLKAQGLTVHFEQEAFSSLMAQENLKQFKKKGIMQDNAEAARIILQSWLDKSLG
jgi:RNase H-fold protein (predicted Holliday junction resolvase)